MQKRLAEDSASQQCQNHVFIFKLASNLKHQEADFIESCGSKNLRKWQASFHVLYPLRGGSYSRGGSGDCGHPLSSGDRGLREEG